MRLRLLLAGAMCFPTFAIHGQTIPAAGPPPKLVDGHKTPELIPDRAAYRLVLLSLAGPETPSENDIARQDRHLVRLGLPDADKAALKQLVATFRARHSDWSKRNAPLAKEAMSQSSTVTKARASQVKAQGTQLTAEGWGIVASTRQALSQQLTPDGLAKLDQFVQQAKKHMVVYVGEDEANEAGTVNYSATASANTCDSPSGIFNTLGCVGGGCAPLGGSTEITIPPQILIQMLYSEAHGQFTRIGDILSAPAIGSAARNRFGRPEFFSPDTYQTLIEAQNQFSYNTSITTGTTPELGAASYLFNGLQPDIVAGAPCFFTPNHTDFVNIQDTYASGSVAFPVITDSSNTKCYAGTAAGPQIVWKTSIPINATRSTDAPAFVFVRQKVAFSDPAVIQIP